MKTLSIVILINDYNISDIDKFVDYSNKLKNEHNITFHIMNNSDFEIKIEKPMENIVVYDKKIASNSEKFIKNLKKSKYFFILNQHYEIVIDGIKKLSLFLTNNSSDIVFTIRDEINADGISKRRKIRSVAMGRCIFKTDSIINKLEKNNRLELIESLFDNWSLGLLFTFNNFKLKSVWWIDKYLIRNVKQERKVKTKLSTENLNSENDHLVNLVRVFYPEKELLENLLKNPIFNKRFSLLIRRIIKLELSKRGIKKKDIDTSETIDILSSIFVKFEILQIIKIAKNLKIKNPLLKKNIISLSKEKDPFIHCLFSFDNLEQFRFMKLAISTIKNKNKLNRINLKIMYKRENFSDKIQDEITDFLKLHGFKNYDIFAIEGKDKIYSHAKFYWMLIPFRLKNIDKIILFDNDLIFNVSFSEMLKPINLNSKKLLSGVALNNFYGGTKKEMADHFCTKKFISNNKSNYINLGVAVLNSKMWRKLFKSEQELKTLFEKRIEIFEKNNFFLSDQDFIWTLYGNKFGKLNLKFNIRLHNMKEKILKEKNDWILHYNLWNDVTVEKFDFFDFFETSKKEPNKAIEDAFNFYKNKNLQEKSRILTEREIEAFKNKLKLLIKFSKN